MAPANDDVAKVDPTAKIDTSARKDEGQVTRVSATEQEQLDRPRGLSSKRERQEGISDFNLWHTVAVREGYAIEADTVNEKIRHAFKGEGKDKTEMGQFNYGESKGWIESTEATLQHPDVVTETRAKGGDLEAQQRLVKGSEDASSEAPRIDLYATGSDQSGLRRQSTLARA